MKKRTWYNLIMVAIIVAIMAGGVLGVGHIRGWFDQADGSPMLSDIVGVVRMERSGVNYTVEKSTVLRVGDIISTQVGATVNITVGNSCVTLGGDAEVVVEELTEPQLRLTAGEVFVDAWDQVRITFEADNGTVSVAAADATMSISYRQGAQTVRVFRGTVENIAAGQEKEYVGETTTVSKIQLESLNSFDLAQIRKANQSVSLCVTNQELDELEEKRRQELEDMINDATEPAHVHEFAVTVVSPTCTETGYTEYRCACGECYRQDEVAALGHRFGAWETVKAATTTENGRQVRKCADCDIQEERDTEKLTPGHIHSYTEQVVAPTCTEKGYTVHTCTCGDSYRDNETPKTDHQYRTQVILPTCTAQGYTLHTCACGDSYIDNVKAATGHDFGDWKVIEEATETQEGTKERICAGCGEKETAVIPKTEQDKYVYITIRCDTILDNIADLTPGKAEFVPANGVILPSVKVSFSEDETVFDVLKRICEKMDIQMEYSWSPMYNSYYIEGINNLYEFDCGSQSGWMYKVNGWFPNYGVSAYKLSQGDQIVFAYTCKGLGTDVGAPEWEG